MRVSMDVDLQKVGKVGVDSGQVMIVDPCYLDRWQGGEFKLDPVTHEPVGPAANDYDAACRVTLSEAQAGQTFEDSAVVSSTAYGDGSYPVYAIRNREGRIRGLFIDFDDVAGLEDEEGGR